MKVSAIHVRPPLEPAPLVLQGCRVLIVDDNQTNRHILVKQAQSWGMNSTECAGGSEALECIQRGQAFDIALLDIQMPDIDGVTLAKQIRSMRSADVLPLVGLSSVGLRQGEVEAAGFAAMLTKPVKQSQLYNVLASILTTQQRPAPLQEGPAYDRELAQRMPLRILMAEDLTVNQKLMQNLLGKFGYRADVAGNGLEALKALERQSYDLILMDVQMPEMDGLEASRQINKRYDEARRPRIVALTANAMKEDQEACLEAGMDDYLSKPVNATALQAVLARWGEWAQARRNPRNGKQSNGTEVAIDGKIQANGYVVELTREAREVSNGNSDRHAISVEEVIDPAFLQDLRAMRDMLPELLETFRSDVRPRLETMRTAIAGNDPDALAAAAHGVKGVSANLGGHELARLCAELEKKGKAGSVAGCGELMPAVEEEFHKLCRALEQEASAPA